MFGFVTADRFGVLVFLYAVSVADAVVIDFVFRCVVFVKIFDVEIVLGTICFVVVFITVVFGNDDDDDVPFDVGVAIDAAEFMIFVFEDATDVFDAAILFVFETCICVFDLIVVIIVDDANNFVADSVDVVLDVVDVCDFDFVDAIEAIVVIDEIDKEIVLVANVDVVDRSFSTLNCT